MKNLFRKILALVLVVAMLIPTISHLGTNFKEVQAEGTTTEITDESIGYVIVPSANVNTDGSQPTVKAGYESDKYSDYLFGGWYTDAKALIASASGETGAYARFVPADVLSVKVQVTNGLVTDTSIDEYRNKYVMRFVSSIDSLDYKNAGFEITFEEDGETVKRTNTTTTGFKRINSTTGSTEKGMDLYEYSPKVISTKSEYFVTAKWPLVKTDQKITVKAFWTTQDGTRVYGGSRCVAVEDNVAVNAGFEEVQKTNVSFKSTKQYSENDPIDNVRYGINDAETTATVIGCSTNANGTYTVHTRVNVVPSSLPSVTQFTFGENETAVYRNLLTKYAGSADRSWYDIDTSKDEFVIATSADLYGLADVVNTSHVTFENKTVYVVADIKVNKGNATESGWSTAGVTNGTSYYWNPIGYRSSATADKNTYYPFLGTFDGQMHTISGINFNSAEVTTDGRYGGLFGPTWHSKTTNATIQNFKLTNSYFYSASAGVGSVSGYAEGNIHTVYSDAIVKSSNVAAGGLVGYGNAVRLDNSWFAGKVITTNTSAKSLEGGLVASTLGSVTMNHCLNTGDIDVSVCTTAYPQAGGLLGYSSASVTITNCLNAGEISVNSSVSGFSYGAIIGYINSGTTSINTTYTDADKCDKVLGYNNVATTSINNQTLSKGMTTSEDVLVTDNVTGEDAKTGFANLDFDNHWTVVTNGTPILTSFEDEIVNPDISWYDDAAVDENGNAPGTAQNPYVLYDKNDLWGLSYLSQTNNFSGKVIRLGADIVVNKGNANEWAECAPKYDWTPIGKYPTGFAGIFDGSDPETGEIHTISGIYNVETTSRRSGLFSETSSAIISNFNLKNSYFKSNQQQLGSVVGYLNGGIIHSIKSNAIVVGSNNVEGGIVGLAGGTPSISNCWFAGKVTNTGTITGTSIGGILGSTISNITMTNCLNTGDIDVSAYTKTTTIDSTNYYNQNAGGLLATAGGNVTITNCLNAGKIIVNSSSDTKTLYGGIVGEISSNKTVNIVGSYNDTTNCLYAYGYKKGTVQVDSQTPTNAATVNEALATGLVNGENKPINSVSYSEGVTGESAKTTFEKLNFDNIWTVTDATPILTTFTGYAIGADMTWYYVNSGATEYILYDVADLYGLAKLSETIGFGGKTVKLAKDIVVNEGTASDWAKCESLPTNNWTPIGSTKEFNGTFDGQGYTISGVYLNSSSSESGLFAKTNISSTIKNLSLKNSYFESTGANLGSIAGLGKGKFYNIYSDAIVKTSNAGVGGLVGSAESLTAYPAYHVILKNCWFDGSVTNTGNGSTGVRGTGGILGVISANANVEFENCLNEGTIDAKAYEYDQNKGTKTDEDGNPILNISPLVGGVVGYIKGNATVDIDGCLNVGEIKYADIATGGYNPLVGFNTAGTTLTISGCYATKESCETIGLSNISSDSVTQVAVDAIKGDIAEAEMKLLDWNNWECRDNDFPTVILATTTSEEVDYEATETDRALLAARYSDYTLYQGDLHGHADNGGSSDGHVALSDWINQMDNAESNLELDFAASLDHKQTWHITQTLWQENIGKLIYGTEAETTITEQKARLHYNMIFTEQSQMKNVLSSFNEFAYREVKDNSILAPAFAYNSFSREKFESMIDKVKKQEGLFVLAHPMQSPDFSKDALDFWFSDYIGFEVVYTQLDCGNTRDNYAAWKTLLANGARMWACSGSDTHNDLTNAALTSVYAKATDKEAGNLVNYLKDGNFTAGSVGIQMCVGDTPMGGHRNFANQRVVVNVGELHTSVYKSTNKYRIDILNEDGIVYSQALTVDETTKTPTNGTIAFNADATSDFYRVVVYDMTNNCRIAYGNPIWNDK